MLVTEFTDALLWKIVIEPQDVQVIEHKKNCQLWLVLSQKCLLVLCKKCLYGFHKVMKQVKRFRLNPEFIQTVSHTGIDRWNRGFQGQRNCQYLVHSHKYLVCSNILPMC